VVLDSEVAESGRDESGRVEGVFIGISEVVVGVRADEFNLHQASLGEIHSLRGTLSKSWCSTFPETTKLRSTDFNCGFSFNINNQHQYTE